MRKIIFFSLLSFLLLFSSPALAWEDTVMRYPTGAYSDIWAESYSTTGTIRSGSYSVSVVSDPSGNGASALKIYGISYPKASFGAQSISIRTTNAQISPDYISFVLLSGSYGNNVNYEPGLYIYIYESGTSTTLATLYRASTPSNTKYEIIKSTSYYNLYANGELVSSVVNNNPGYSGNIDIGITQKISAGYPQNTQITVSAEVYISQFTDGSSIGIPTTINEGNTNFLFTWSAQLMRNFGSQYTISLYSLTNPENGGLIQEWDIPQNDNSSSSEYGYVSTSLNTLLAENTGLYLLEMKRADSIISDQYFYYYLLSSPQDLPEILFLAKSDVNAEIRDDSNYGGEILGGGSVYLYPDILEGGVYNISYDILETPYSIEAEITKVYNTTDLNGTNILFSGLSSQNYYVSVDGTAVNGTNGSDTWDCFVSWDSLNSHIISFAPDYTLPGVYGYIKNSETQNPLKSATVSISNGSVTEYLFTDDNGMYYFTRGMVPGSYNVTASKSGFTTSVPYYVITQNGSTTRKDIFLDPVSGAGVYYAPHDVIFTVLEYWYSSAGLPGVSYAVYDDENESVKNGTTGSKGTFTVTEMDAGKNYTFILTHNGTTYTEYIEPGLTEYTLVLNKEGIVHQYYNSWLNLTYAENSNNVTVLYTSSKTVSEASFIVTASNGTIVQSNTLNTTSGTFLFNFTEGDYILQFNIEASDGSTASQAWSVSSPPEVTLFPASYPTWLKNTLFTAIIIIFLLAFGKSKNDIACGSVAVLTSLGYYFEWLSCGFNFVVLIWIIALGAIFLHYKRTGAVG